MMLKNSQKTARDQLWNCVSWCVLLSEFVRKNRLFIILRFFHTHTPAQGPAPVFYEAIFSAYFALAWKYHLFFHLPQSFLAIYYIFLLPYIL